MGVYFMEVMQVLLRTLYTSNLIDPPHSPFISHDKRDSNRTCKSPNLLNNLHSILLRSLNMEKSHFFYLAGEGQARLCLTDHCWSLPILCNVTLLKLNLFPVIKFPKVFAWTPIIIFRHTCIWTEFRFLMNFRYI